MAAAPDLVSVPWNGAALAVPIRDGVADLREARVVHGDPTKVFTTGTPEPDPGLAPALLDAGAVLGLIGAALARGCRVRLHLRGASMRLAIPDGALAEVEALGPRPVRRGEILLASPDGRELVAHRARRRAGTDWVLRGDTASREDRVAEDRILGRVVAHQDPRRGRPVRTNSWSRRLRGLLVGALHPPLVTLARAAIVRPLREVPVLRRAAGLGLRLLSGALRIAEALAFRIRRPVDRARAGLLATTEKDADRRRLYSRRAVREFAALDENVEAGLTLLEEVLLRRHPLPEGPVLVLGSGPGRECVALAKAGHRVAGLDRDPAMLARARELARRHGVEIEGIPGEAADFDLGDRRFGSVLILSGLYNMLMPSTARMAMLRAAARHLAPGGRILLTFLSDYVPPGAPPPHRRRGLLAAINPDHEPGDLYLVNEAVHIHPHPARLLEEVEAAGLRLVDLFRDQRAYDRRRGQVRGFAVLAPRAP